MNPQTITPHSTTETNTPSLLTIESTISRILFVFNPCITTVKCGNNQATCEVNLVISSALLKSS